MCYKIIYDCSIQIEKFTYSTTDMRDRWLSLLEDIHFLGVSVCKNRESICLCN